MPKIAFIGIGNMGAPMAVNLAKAGFAVSVFDLIADKMHAIRADGIGANNAWANSIKVCENHQQAISEADIVWTMLPTGVEVKEVFINQLFKHCNANCLLVDSSTIDISDATAIHRLAAAKGYATLDAPVSGGTVGAHNATLSFMVGGSGDSLARAQPAFAAMGKTVVHCGQGGMGQAAKTCNNLMLGIQMIAVAEGFKLAAAVELDQQTLFNVASVASGDCFALRTFCPVPELVASAPSSNDFKPGFSSKLMLKDMRLALNAAQNAQLSLPLAEDAASLYQELVDIGDGAKDFSAVIKLPR